MLLSVNLVHSILTKPVAETLTPRKVVAALLKRLSQYTMKLYNQDVSKYLMPDYIREEFHENDICKHDSNATYKGM